MASDFNKPVVGDAYATLLPGIVTMFQDLARGLEPTLTGVSTNVPTGTVRWNAASNLWERYNGTAWAALTATYAISISGNAATATKATHIAGGLVGQLHYQSGADTTALLAAGAAGTVLVSGGGAAPVWTLQSALTAGAAPWTGISGKPTTVVGYGITDAITTANIGSQTVANSASLGGTAAASYALVAQTVALTGAQTIAGVKTFSSQPVLPQQPTLGTAVATTSGTAIDFTGIPSWVKRITVMFNGVSTNGVSYVVLRVGSSAGIEAAGYVSSSGLVYGVNVTSTVSSTTDFLINLGAANSLRSGSLILTNIGGSTWVLCGCIGDGENGFGVFNSGSKTLTGALDRLRFTTVNGTDTFDAGSVNILYE